MRWWLVAAMLVACGARTDLGERAAVDASSDAAADVVADGSLGPCALGVLAKTGAKPDTIALDDAFLYWHDARGVSRVPKAGGASALVAASPSSYWPTLVAFALAGGYVFFSDVVGTASRVAVTGGAPETLGWNRPVLGFAASATRVYAWGLQGGATPIVRFGLDGSGPEQVDYLPHAPNEMVFGPNEIAYVAADPDVRQIDYSGATNEDVLLSGLAAVDVAPSGTDVYFTSNDATNGARLLVLSTDTLQTEPIADTTGASALALDGSDVYFTDALGLRVRRLVGKSGAVQDVATVGPDAAPIDVAVDDACVYWTAAPRDGTSPGALMVAPK